MDVKEELQLSPCHSTVDINELVVGEHSYICLPPSPTPVETTVRSVRGRPKGSTFKAPAPSRTTISSSRRKPVPRNSEEYRERRDRNNVAVRKSREKAREKQQHTEHRLKILSDKNDELQKKVDLLTKELTVLKGLFVNIGAALPKQIDSLLE